VYNYYSENFDATLNENWGNSDNNFTYRQQAIGPIILNPFELNFDVQNVFETFIPTPNIPIDSDKIFDLFLEKLPQNAVDKLQENLENQTNSKSPEEIQLEQQQQAQKESEAKAKKKRRRNTIIGVIVVVAIVGGIVAYKKGLFRKKASV
jgi:hypothetical protein